MHRTLLVLTISAMVAGLAACATVDPTCEQEIDACLERCEKSGGTEVKVEQITPEVSTTWCEQRCQKCGHNTTPPAAPPASSPPTYTGNAPSP